MRLMADILVLLCAGMCAGMVATLYFLLEGAFHAHRNRVTSNTGDPAFLLKSRLVPEVAVIAAPPDASEVSLRFARRLARLHFGRLEVVLVLDGPSAAALDIWKREFQLVRVPREASTALPTKPVNAVYASSGPLPLIVVDKERGGEGDSLNAAINLTSAPVIGLADWSADIAEDALLRIICPMIDDAGRTIAVCAVAPSAPAPSRAARLHHVEFLRLWLCRCAGLSVWNSLLPAPGSFLLFSRDAVVQARGFQSEPGCALELVMRLHKLALSGRRAYRIRLLPACVSRPAPPVSARELNYRAARDQSAVAATLARHVAMLAGFGGISRLAIPGLFCTRLVLPLLETACLALAIPTMAYGWMPAADVLLLVAAANASGILVSMTAVVLEPFASGSRIPPRELLALFLTAIPENIGYRQWRNLKLIAKFLRACWIAPSEAN